MLFCIILYQNHIYTGRLCYTLRWCHLKTITFQCIYGFAMLWPRINGLFDQCRSEGKIDCQGGAGTLNKQCKARHAEFIRRPILSVKIPIWNDKIYNRRHWIFEYSQTNPWTRQGYKKFTNTLYFKCFVDSKGNFDILNLMPNCLCSPMLAMLVKGISRGPEAVQNHLNDFYHTSVLCWP